MRLEMGTFPVRQIKFSEQTRLAGEVLEVCRQELLDLISADPRFAAIEIDLVQPGESARVVHVCDAIEPRIKVQGPGDCYPGILGSIETVGQGTTHRLEGMAVVLSAEYPREIATGTGAALEGILDMTGPGAVGPLSETRNLVLAASFAPGHSLADYHSALQQAGFRIAHRLAQTTVGTKPPATRIYHRSPAVDLPKVVYVHQSLTQLNMPVAGITWYGNYITDWMPLWAHPNEIIDGALLPGVLGGHAAKPTSWEHLNHPVIDRLYGAHGKTLDFLGVIFHRTRFETFEEKQLSANQASKLAKLAGAEGAIITWVGAGNAFMEGMLTTQALEREGIKSVFMTYEHGGKEGLDTPLMYSVPEADAIVSTGSLDRPVSLPPVGRVVGGSDLNVSPESRGARIPSEAAIELGWQLPVLSAVDHWGFGKRICVDY